MIRAEVAADKRSFTLGIEGISARLRAFLNKSLSSEDINAVVTSFFRETIREIKFFFILTGCETSEDISESDLLSKR